MANQPNRDADLALICEMCEISQVNAAALLDHFGGDANQTCLRWFEDCAYCKRVLDVSLPPVLMPGPGVAAADVDVAINTWARHQAARLLCRHGKQGVKRVLAEFRYLAAQVAAGQHPQIHDLELVNDNAFSWRFKLKGFDNDLPGGRNLNADLAELKQKHGQDHLRLAAAFPPDYPAKLFFLRLLSPRCLWYTGHVTAGGSVCIEALTLGGSPGSWTPAMCVESILNVVITNFLDCEAYQVTTATGPGGMTGPLRIDLNSKYGRPALQAYSDAEAQAAFRRMESHHKQNGW